MPCQVAMYVRSPAQLKGWQEIVYSPLDDPAVAINNAIGGLVDLRAQSLSGDCEIHAMRASFVGSPRRSVTSKFLNPVKGGNTETSNEINDCVNYLLFNVDHTSKRQYHFRGLPDSWIANGALTKTGDGKALLFSQYLAYLVEQGYGILRPSSANPRIQILSMVQSLGEPKFTTLAAHNLNANDLIIMRAFKSLPLLNGRWRVGGISADNEFRLVGGDQLNIPAGGQSLGTVQKSGPSFTSLADYRFDGVSNKKTGRPFGLPRGRRSPAWRRR